MPLYSFRCKRCNTLFELRMSMEEVPEVGTSYQGSLPLTCECDDGPEAIRTLEHAPMMSMSFRRTALT